MENPVDGVVDCARNGRPLAAAFFFGTDGFIGARCRPNPRHFPWPPVSSSAIAAAHLSARHLGNFCRDLLIGCFFLPDLTAGVDGITMRFQYEDSVRHRWRRRRRRRCRTEFSGGFVCGSDDDGGDTGVWGGRSHKRERRKKRTEKRRKTNKK